MDTIYYCSKEYHYLANDLLRDFAISVQEKMYHNFLFFGFNKYYRPPIEDGAFAELINEFQVGYVKLNNTRLNVASEVKSMRFRLIGVLDRITSHVEIIAKGDDKIISKCGFNPIINRENYD